MVQHTAPFNHQAHITAVHTDEPTTSHSPKRPIDAPAVDEYFKNVKSYTTAMSCSTKLKQIYASWTALLCSCTS